MGQGINQYDVFWVSLDPTKGNKNRIGNVIGHLKQSEIENIKSVLMEMFC